MMTPMKKIMMIMKKMKKTMRTITIADTAIPARMAVSNAGDLEVE